MEICIHNNVWGWGRKVTVIGSDGSAMVSLSLIKGDDSIGYIADLSVVPYKRKEGRGSEILGRIEELAKTYGCTTACIGVQKDNVLQAWFKKRGYTQTPELSPDGLTIMAKKLGPLKS